MNCKLFAINNIAIFYAITAIYFDALLWILIFTFEMIMNNIIEVFLY